MNSSHHVPPGFRFHPTDEELVDYYLRRKVNSTTIDLDVIKVVDLYKIEPWDLQEVCRVGREEQNEWYFFSHKDKKYPTGTRTNRATAAGFWKATGRDKAIYSNLNSKQQQQQHELIGMRKTLVFYKGRAPNGLKSDWIMHEYRLESDENATPQEEGWVVCRVFKKRVTTTTATTMNMKHDSPSCSWYDEQQVPLMQQDHYFDSSSSSSKQIIIPHHHPPPNYNNNDLVLYQQHHLPFPFPKKLLEVQPACASADHHPHLPREHYFLHHQHHQLPLLDNHNPELLLQQSPNMPPYDPSMMLVQPQHKEALVFGNNNNNNNTSGEQSSSSSLAAADWRVLDKFVSSQLISQEDHAVLPPQTHNNDASTSNSTSPMDLVWK